MELKVSAPEPCRSPSLSESNPDEKEISDDDDDDRNHKHRRREDARSQSQEGELYTKPYKRGNKPFENGHIYRETGSHSNDTWKNSMGKRRQGPSDLNQRIRGNHGDPGLVRGRGRDSGLWNQHDPRFNSVDIASRIVQQGSVPVPVPVPGMFSGRGLPNVSNAYGASWSAFGLVPGIPNGGMDTLHTLGLQGTYRSINPNMNMGLGLARQRCRDFEEQGFCLRGDMCPMEHGVNRIVVEDVQSLSQFNLPVSLQTANLSGPPSGFAGKPSRGKITKRGNNNDDSILDPAGGVGADFYDPDQPLWGNDSQPPPAPPPVMETINQSNALDPGPSGCDESGTKSKTETKENIQNERIEKQETNSLKTQSGNGKNAPGNKQPWAGSQKAQCTLFVGRIPVQQNKREILISHFHKFGEVIDIHIPINSERAFVQFSKREEAEAALKAPDAVMGNRFIKLNWANRDNIPIPIARGPPVLSTSPAKPVIINGPKVLPPSQKKLETLEVLKEELRKKQEMLDQKRNDFRRKLDKLAKQTTAQKGETEPEQVAKRQRVGNVGETALVKATGNGNKSVESAVPQTSKSELPVLKPSLRPSVPIGLPPVTNRFKLDNRPTAFKIVSSLPNDLANVAVLKEHFSPFGDLSKVEVVDDGDNAHVYFTSRVSAEKAFTSGKSLKGHNLQFSWIKSSNQKDGESPSKRNPDSSVSMVEISKSDYQKPSEDQESEKVEKMEIDKEEDQSNKD